jgi:hypothetical protein
MIDKLWGLIGRSLEQADVLLTAQRECYTVVWTKPNSRFFKLRKNGCYVIRATRDGNDKIVLLVNATLEPSESVFHALENIEEGFL